MHTFEISVEICLGFCHWGGVYEENTGKLSLTDEEIGTIRNIMDKVMAEDEDADLHDFDLGSGGLEEADPELYRKVYNAYYDCAREANFRYWTENGYNECHIVDEIDWERALEISRDRYGYSPEGEVEYDDDYDCLDADEEEECEVDYDPRLDSHFRQWFKANVIDDTDRLLELEREESLIGVDAEDFDFNCPLLIPGTLVDEYLAKRKS